MRTVTTKTGLGIQSCRPILHCNLCISLFVFRFEVFVFLGGFWGVFFTYSLKLRIVHEKKC